MKKVIVGIHGLGNKPPKYLIQKWWKEAMLEGFDLNGFKKKLPDFELVYWADILYEKPLNYWAKDQNDPYYLEEPYHKEPKEIVVEDHSIRQKVTDFITEQMNKIFLNDDKSLNYSFITDAILKKYFRDLEIYYTEVCKDENDKTCKVGDLIRHRVVEVIKKYKNYDVMIIGHSMGSIIAFDVLNFLIPEIEINTLITLGSPLGLPVVISKIAAEQKRHLEGQSIMATPPGVRENWYNMTDIMDHVAFNYKLNDDFVANHRGIYPVDFLVSNNYQANGNKNSHKSFGYLRTPEFTRVLNDFIGDQKPNIGQKILGEIQKILEKTKEQGHLVKDRLKLN